MTFHESFARTTIRFLMTFSCLCLPGTAASAETSHYVSDALPIELGGTLRGAGLAAGEPDCFRVDTPSAGLLMIDVAVAGDAGAEPLLGLLSSGCGSRPVVVERSASHLLVRSDAARSLVACVGPQDPRRRVGDYKLRTAFQATSACKSTDPEQIEVDPDPLIGCVGFDRSTDPEQIEADPDPFLAGVAFGKSTDPEQIEADPDPLIGCVGFDRSTDPEQIEADPDPIFAGVFDKSTDPEQIEADPDPFFAGVVFDKSTDPEQIEADPDPLVAGVVFDKSTDPEQIEADPDPLRTGPIDALCAAGESDDHADVFLCATPVASGSAAGGEIANARGDDHDLFVFQLTASGTVRIETAGAVDTFGGLYDRRGQRLAAAAGGGEDGNFRLVKNLPAGLYFVRVEGQAWSQGAYSLAVETLERGW